MNTLAPKGKYPNCNPSPLRITTHTIKGSINIKENKTTFKIDLVELAKQLEIDNQIKYIEYKNKEVVHVKGINPKNVSPKKISKKGKFYNCLTIHVEPEFGFRNNIKLFRNGSISGTGIKKIENGKDSLKIILDRIKNIEESVVSYEDSKLDNADCILNDYSIALINSDYDISYEINRLELHSMLIKKYKIFSSYEPCIYPGVNSKFYWNEKYKNMEHYGKCYCTVPCDGKGNGSGNGNCKKITIAIFQSGSVIITGARSIEQIYTAYNFINNIFETQSDKLKQLGPSFLTVEDLKLKDTKKERKNIIYLKKENIIK
tara:strand:+ start:25128 stop:26078 length:951 start_codon:yes stop_codon:yes gene_type:complete